MLNYKTTIAGLIAAVLPWLGSVFPDLKVIFDAAGSFALVLLGYFAKDAKSPVA